MRIRQFKPLRPSKELVSKVASLPYDVVSTEEARQLAEGNPLSMLHVVRAEIDFPQGQNQYADAVYAKAVENFKKLQSDGALVREDKPGLYIYQQQMGQHIQRGIAATCLVEDYENNLIKKHEKTRPDKENDRTRLTSEMSANAGPVFLCYRDEQKVMQIVDAATDSEPLFDFTAEDGIRHTIWRVPNPDELVQAFESIPCTYVADGHHRSASAARVGNERKQANPNHTGEEDYNAFLSVIFPASQLKILPYNRLVADLNGATPEQLLAKLGEVGALEPTTNPEADSPGQVCIYLGGEWRLLKFNQPFGDDPVSRLDVSLLQDRVLSPFLGVNDPRTDERISFVGGIRGTKWLQQEVDAGRAAIAFSMHPTTIEQLMEIADAGQIMPPKSTWFEPKLRSGLLIHTF